MEAVKLHLKSSVATLRTHYLHIFAFALVLSSVFVVYGNDFGILISEALQNEALSHILLMPFFVGFLFYLKKDAVKAALAIDTHRKRTTVKSVNEILGVALCLVAFLVYWYGSQTFYPLEYHILSLPIFIAGVILVLLNPRALLLLIFPILFLLFLVPLPATFLYTFGGGLANFNTQVSYSILKTVGLPITLSSSYGAPTILLTSSSGQPLNFAVDVACSGIYSLVAFTMFATFLAFLAKTSIFKKLLLFILGFVVFAALNILRIISIVVVGYSFGEEAALLLHSFAGLVLIFSGMLLILVFSDKVLKIQIATRPEEQPPCPKCKRETQPLISFCQNCGRFIGKSSRFISKTLFVKLFLLLLGCSIVVLSISAPTFATAKDSIELESSGNLQNSTNVFPEIPDYTLAFLYRDTEYEEIAAQDTSLVYGYFPSNISDQVVYAVAGVSSSISNLHNWEVCFAAFQTAQGQSPLVKVHDSRDIQLLEDPALIAKYFVFDSPDGYTQITLYWYEKATFKTGLSVEQKYVRISLIILTQNSADYPQLEEELLAIGQVIATTWEPLKSQALISLGVPAQQALLAVSIAFLAVTITTQYFSEKRKASNNLKLFNNFASPEEKLVFQTVLDLAEEKKNIKTSDILENVRKKHGGRSMSLKKVLNALNVLDEYSLIRRTVVSVGNTPVLVWKV
ncbi:exosortase/archaeosortase family protein [Candidatus Bathyarchaeota archaeon]|nr:exosortase/archaeosortase family protein [Candidatus Bathyarchaeota archaeon]